MHWALLILTIGFGTVPGVRSQADLRLASQEACGAAANTILQAHTQAFRRRGYNPPGPIELVIACIPVDTPLPPAD